MGKENEDKVPDAADAGKGGSEDKTKTADAETVTLKKADLDKMLSDIDYLKKQNQEAIDTRQKAKADAKAAEEKAKAEADKAKPLEDKVALLQKQLDDDRAERELENKRHTEQLLKEKKLAAIAGMEGIDGGWMPSQILPLLDDKIVLTDKGEVDLAKLAETINGMPFRKTAEIKPKVPMGGGMPNEKERGQKKEMPGFFLDAAALEESMRPKK